MQSTQSGADESWIMLHEGSALSFSAEHIDWQALGGYNAKKQWYFVYPIYLLFLYLANGISAHSCPRNFYFFSLGKVRSCRYCVK